jgi:hypothetical protein
MSVLKRTWTHLTHLFFNVLTRKAEIRAWPASNRSGATWWNVYDPRTGKTYQFASEAEVRIWLDSELSRSRW